MSTLDTETRGRLRQMQRSEKDKRRYVKITVLLMLDLEFSVEQTATALGVDGATVYCYSETYGQSKSLSDYLQNHHVPYAGRLSTRQRKKLEER